MLHLLPPPPPNTTTAPKSKHSYKRCPSLVHSRYCDLSRLCLSEGPKSCPLCLRTPHTPCRSLPLGMAGTRVARALDQQTLPIWAGVYLEKQKCHLIFNGKGPPSLDPTRNQRELV